MAPLAIDEYKHQLAAKYGDRRLAEFQAEWKQVQQYFEAVSDKLSDTYTIEKVLAVGGTGIVHIAQHKRFDKPVAIKINRPNVDPEAVSMVANEATVLPTLHHPNIIQVLDLGELGEYTPKLTYIVEPFVTGSRPLFTSSKPDREGTWLGVAIERLRKTFPGAPPPHLDDNSGQATQQVLSLLGDVAALFSQWASLLHHVHSHRLAVPSGYVYLDVKPENVLVDEHAHLTSIDYGSIEHLDPTDHSPLEVFFTELYAHPDLLRKKKDKASSNRVRAGIKRSELNHAFDYYALGSSLLEVLNAIAEIRPHVIPRLPLYRSLHFLATRLLVGHNSSRQQDNHYPLAAQVFPSLREADYDTLKYHNLDDVYRDLAKERGGWNLDERVPELAAYSRDIVRVVPGFNTVLTPRLRGAIEHPLVARLKHVTQLGLVSLVYPTADHSRYDHALGSYTYTTYYVKSLFNDLGNPVFRSLVDSTDLSAVLLAALLHDLGQYPLAHDLEEVHARIFKHGRIGLELLEDTMVDQHGRTLRQIIEDPDNGWGVSIDLLRRILGAHTKNASLTAEDGEDTADVSPQTASFKIEVLAAIIDGPVDADKADYIIRDSARCELPYGAQLDLERLLRVLTVAIIPDEATPQRRFTLGVYDKGIVSAHAFGQARYQLLSSVYWHHTVRIAKAMLQYATAIGLPREVFGVESHRRRVSELELRERLLAFIKALVPPFAMPHNAQQPPVRRNSGALDMESTPPEEVLDTVLSETEGLTTATGATKWYPGVAWTDWLMLEWVRGLPSATEHSRALIDGIQTRQLYKRIAAFVRGGPHDSIIHQLEALSWSERIAVCQKLHDCVCKKLRRQWGSLDTASFMNKSSFDKLASSRLLILIDIPVPAKKIGFDRPLGIVPELRDKASQQDVRQASEDKLWRETMTRMVGGIAPVRILCHPHVRNLVCAAYSPLDGTMATEVTGILAEIDH